MILKCGEVYSLKDRQRPLCETKVRISNNINRKDTIPFYDKCGFLINGDLQRDLKDYTPKGTVAILTTKSLLTFF